jgi:hypothetical protein
MSNTYWNGKGQYQEAVTQLQKLLPKEGEVNEPRKNKALEKFRRASNCYYDLYNNGLCNRACEFRRVFDIAASKHVLAQHGFCCTYTPELFEAVEKKMDAIIAEAVLEQSAPLSLLSSAAE